VRVLRPGGLLLFSTFGPDTLSELRAAWAAADDRSHVSLFPDMHELGNGLMHAGLAEPVLDVEHLRLHYADARALMRELKLLGAHNAADDRVRGLTGREHLDRMLSAYEGMREEKGLPATFEVISGAAFADDGTSHAGHQSPGPSGEVAVPVTAIRTARR
jgi:malonyl-CoA O-methyltransferase